MPCPHGQGGDGWGPGQRGNGPRYLARSVVYPQASPPHPFGGAELGIEERVTAARAGHVLLGARCAGFIAKRRLKGCDSGVCWHCP